MSFSDLERPSSDNLGRALLLSVLGSAGFAAASVTLLLIGTSGSGYHSLTLIVVVSAFLLASVVIGAAAITVGLPLTWALARSRLERPWVYPLAGFCLGALIVVPLVLVLNTGSTYAFEPLGFMPFGAFPGFVCGVIWWRTYRRHRQDPET